MNHIILMYILLFVWIIVCSLRLEIFPRGFSRFHLCTQYERNNNTKENQSALNEQERAFVIIHTYEVREKGKSGGKLCRINPIQYDLI